MAKRRVIVDGYNLMFRDEGPEGASLASAREAFLRRVDAARGAREHVTVVFDGRGGAGDRGDAPAGTRVVWARSPRTADDVIVDLVAKHPRGQVEVLTYDRELRHRVKSAGGVPGDPDAFFTRSRPKRRTGPRAARKPPPPTGAELDEWEKLFGGDEGA